MNTAPADGRRYRLHGYDLVVDPAWQLPIPAAEAPQAPSAVPSLRVVSGDRRPVPPTAPEGRLVARLPDDDGGAFYTFTCGPDGLLLRWHGVLDLEADHNLTTAVAHLHPGTDEGLLSVLLPGTVLAVRLMLDGHLVLHASAVRHDGRAVAFVGPSGGGKSTLAALGMLSGQDLVTDDVLRVDLSPAGAPTVWPGATSVRLRPGAAGLGRRRAGVARTADGRIDLPAARTLDAPLPLHCLVLPTLAVRGRELRVERVGPDVAMRALAAAPRVAGWSRGVELARQFHQFAELCEAVPVVAVSVPGARRNDPAVVPELVARLPAAG